MPATEQILVGMSQIQVRQGGAKFICFGLGASIGLVAIDSEADVTGVAHIILPESSQNKPQEKPGAFADTAIPELIQQMESQGAHPSRIICAFVGGAGVFTFGGEPDSRLNIGARNSRAVEQQLNRAGLRTLVADVGGCNGRTLSVDSASGEVRVRTINDGERTLCLLKRTQREAA